MIIIYQHELSFLGYNLALDMNSVSTV